MNWMSGLSLLLFWLPVAGPLIAGTVGGFKAGTVRRSLAAVIVPGIGTGVLVFAGVTWLTKLPLWGIVAGVGGIVLSFLHVGPMLVGAIGGALAAQLTRHTRGSA
ncbi:MAG: hypothetical protein H0U85_04405 [Gemmatimonadales bacterium]|nr:hypothetical protein [Gemmatimonadales bacterium]